MIDPVICPDCGQCMILRQTSKFSYGDGTPRQFYGCSQWPHCRATHGAHPDGRPLGIPGDQPTKLARNDAHRYFDLLWKSGKMSRRESYRWMQRSLNLSVDQAHIGKFDIAMCRELIEVITEWFPALIALEKQGASR